MRRPAGPALLTAALVVALTGCGDGVDGPTDRPGPERVDQDREDEVAGDDDATAAEVVEAGSAAAADRAADGSLLIVYYAVHRDGSEVAQAAWRLYDADGSPVAQDKLDSDFQGDDEPIGLQDSHYLTGVGVIGADGAITEAGQGGQLPAEAGDVLLQEFEAVEAFRPDPPTEFTPAPAPSARSQGAAISRNGRFWSLELRGDRVTTVVVADDGRWREVAPVALEGEQRLRGFGLVPVGDQLVVPVVRSVDRASAVVYHRIAVRGTDEPVNARWGYLDPGPLGSGKWDALDRTSFAVDERFYFVNDYRHGAHALDVATGEWSEVPAPTRDAWELKPGDGGLYAFHTDYARAYFSTDLGRTWRPLPH